MKKSGKTKQKELRKLATTPQTNLLNDIKRKSKYKGIFLDILI